MSRARGTQIMNLNLLAPDIQEDILFLPLVEAGRDPVKERAVRPILAVLEWGKQRRMWRHGARLARHLTPVRRGFRPHPRSEPGC